MKAKIIIFWILFAGLWLWNLITATFVINLSSSMPIGIYYRVSNARIQRGDIVAACLPSLIAGTGRYAGYLLRGRCAISHSTPVLKEVIVLPNDAIHLTSKGICVNQNCYWAPIQKEDSAGHPVVRYIEEGHYRSTGYWLYGSANPVFSWDSRYFGAISNQNMISVYRNINNLFYQTLHPKVPARLPFAKGSLNGSFLLNEVMPH